MISKIFTTKTDAVLFIEDGLGCEGTHNIALRIYEKLNDNDQIHFDGSASDMPYDLWEFAIKYGLV